MAETAVADGYNQVLTPFETGSGEIEQAEVETVQHHLGAVTGHKSRPPTLANQVGLLMLYNQLISFQDEGSA